MTEPAADHHIQARIVDQLFYRGPQSFSQLQQDGVENSLFMYHAKKLMHRGVIKKCPEGFCLTATGVRWANRSDDTYRPLRAPRLLVQLFVAHNDRLLVSERADHLATHTNRYMLPGGVHYYGKTAIENAEYIADKFHLTLSRTTPIGTSEFIDTNTDHHGIVTYYEATAPTGDYHYQDEVFTMSFIKPSDIATQNPHLDTLIKLYRQQHFPFAFTLQR